MIHVFQKKTRWLYFWIGLIGMLAACRIVPAGTPSDYPYHLLMTPEDLPAGWRRAGGEAPEAPGGISRSVQFAGSTAPLEEYLLVDHQLTVYPSDRLAADAYPEWERTWFPTEAWEPQVEAAFEPSDPKDQFRFACMKVKINTLPVLACGYLQQHRNLVTLVLVNIDGKAITLEQFEQALARLDERLQSVGPEAAPSPGP